MDLTIRNEKPAFSHHDYTMQLVQHEMQQGTLSEARQTELRTVLTEAAAERAAQFTGGRSTTVSRRQAEKFYAAVLFQLDAALLAYGNDDAACNALRVTPVPKLMEAGAQRILTLYEEAKADFREAYTLTSPFQTSFFHDLLSGFQRFTTKYDARFHAKEVREYVEFCYPLMCGQMPDEDGLIAVHAYYRALRLEGEFLRIFPITAVQGLMKRYAARFLTTPEMIAENIAELVFRHWITGALTGTAGEDPLAIPQEAAEILTAQYAGRSVNDLHSAMLDAAAALPGTPGDGGMQKYVHDALPFLADELHSHIEKGSLNGWLKTV